MKSSVPPHSLLCTLVLALCLVGLPAQAQEDVEITLPGLVLKGVPFDVSVKDPSGRVADGSTVTLTVCGQTFDAIVADGEATFTGAFYPDSEDMTYTVTFEDYGTEKEITAP